MKIAIVGTGYVGLVTGTCFSEMGVAKFILRLHLNYSCLRAMNIREILKEII